MNPGDGMSIGTAVASLGAIVGIAATVMAALLNVIRTTTKSDVTRLDGRIDSHEAGCDQRQKGIDQQLSDIKHYVERMETKIDSLVQALAAVTAATAAAAAAAAAVAANQRTSSQ